MLSYQDTVNPDLTERFPAAPESWENSQEISDLLQEKYMLSQTSFSRNFLLEDLLYNSDKFAKCAGTGPKSGGFYDPKGTLRPENQQIKSEECVDLDRLLYDNSDESAAIQAIQIAEEIDLSNYFDENRDKRADNLQFTFKSNDISSYKTEYTTNNNIVRSGFQSANTSASQSPTNVLSTMNSPTHEFYLMNATDISADGNFFNNPIYDNVLCDENLFYTPDNSCGPLAADFINDRNKKPSLTLNLKSTFVNQDEINTPNIIDTIIEASEQPLQFMKHDKENIFNEVPFFTTSSPQEYTPCPSTSSPAAVSDTMDSVPSSITTPVPVNQRVRRPGRPRKRRYDSENEGIDDEDEDETYIPPSHFIRRKSRESRMAKKEIVYEDISEDEDYKLPLRLNPADRLSVTGDIENELMRAGKRGRPPKHARSISSDDYSLLDPEDAKYREMRDRNNEASRKSRYKRRQKEMQVCDELDDLEMDNIKLKAQVEELQKTVERYRDNLMQVMLAKK